MTEERLQVLLLDDEDSLRMPLKKYLEKHFGYHVAAVASGEETLWLVEETQGRYDVALIDEVLLDGLDGIQVMEEIKALYPDIECIVFTGWGTASRQRALQAGAFRYLEKPFDNDELAMLIRTAAQQVRLRGIGRAILSERDLDRVLESIAGAARSLALADEAAIVLLDRVTRRLRMHATRTYPAEQRWWRHFEDQDLSKEIIQTGQVVRVPDTTQDVRVDQKVIDTGICAFLGVPIPGEGSNLGVLYVYSRRPGRFDEWGTVAVLQTLAGQAGLAIANARAFQQIHAYAGYMEALVQAGQGLTKTTRLEDQLAMAWDFVRGQLNVSTFFVALYDKQTDLLCFPLAYDEGQPIEIHDRSLGDDPKQWGITGYVIKSGQQLYWPTDEKKQQQCEALGIESVQIGKPCQSCFYLPLKIGDEVIGVASIQSYDRHAFTPILLDACRTLGSQLSVALENAHLFDATRRASEQLSALNQVVLEIGKELSQDALLRRIIEQAMTLVSAEGGRIYLLDATGEHLTLATTAGLSLDLEGQRIGKNEGLTGEILRTRKPQKVADYYRWRKRLRILDAYKLTGVAGAPILVGDRVLGTLVVHDTRPGKQFDDTMLTLLQQFANHAGLALLKAELLERLQAIQQVSTTITSSLESQEVLNCICQAAVELFGVDHSGLVLFDKSLKWGTVEGEYPAQPNTLGTKIPIEGVLAEERLAFNGETLVFSDVEEAVSELGPVLDIWRRLDIRSIFVIPIIYQNRSLGSFSLDAVGHVRQFTSEEVELCKVFAAHVAVAVENARLFSELVEAKEWREALIEYAFDAVIAIDQDAKITVFNQRAEEMFGWTAEEMIGNTVARLHTDVGKAREIFNVVNREGAITDWDVELKHRDGTRIPALLSAMLIRDSQGNPIGQSGFIRDLRLVQLYENRLHALLHVSQAITETLEPEQVLKLVVDSAIAVFPAAQKGSIHLYDEKTGVLHIKASHGYSPEVVKALTLKVGEGRAGWVYEHAIPLVIGNVQEDERSRQVDRKIKHPEVQEQKSAICVPLVVGDRVIGTLSLDNVTTFDAFESEDLRLLSIFASQAAIALVNAELMTKNRERLRKLEMLSQASNEMMSNLHSLSFDDRLNLIVRYAAQVLDAEASTILLVKRPGFLTKEACYGHIEKDYQKGKEFAIKSGRKTGLTGHIAYTGELFNAHGDDLMGHWAGTSKADQVPSGKCCSLLAIPLKRQLGNTEQLIGTLEVENKKDTDGQPKSHIGFTEEDEWILSIFAETVVTCLENAELYERTSDRLEEKVATLKAIQETGAAISAKLDLDELLELITQKAAAVFAAPAASLMLWDNREENLVVRAKHGLTDEYTQQRVPREKVDAAIAPMGGLHPLVTVDLRSTPFGRLDLIEAEHLFSVLSAPLAVSDRLIGILNIYSKDEPCQFTADEIEVAEVLASQAAVAIRNAQLYDETIRRATQLAVASEVARDAAAILDVEQLLDETVRLISERFGFYHAGVFLLDDKREYAVLHAASSDGGRRMLERRHKLKVGEVGIVGFVIGTGEPRIALDVGKDAVHFANPDLPDTRSEIALPLAVRGQVIGVLDVQSTEVGAFTEGDVATLQTMADQLAVAIESARLYQMLQQEAKQLALINQIAAEISSTLDLDKILQTLVNELAQVIRVEQCAIALFDERGEYGDVVAEYLEEGCVPSKGIFRIPLRDNPTIELVRETKKPVAVKDAQSDPLLEKVWDIMKQRRTQSIMIVPIVIGSEVIGTIGLDAISGPRDFTGEEQWLAETIAHHASIAIQNARRYEELKHTKGLVGARTALAWMGMASFSWRHAIGNYAITIQDLVELAWRDLAAGATVEKIRERLSCIEDIAVRIQGAPITAPLQAEEGVRSVAINELLKERVKQLWGREPYKSVQIALDPRVDESTTVRANPDWLRRAFDILIDNAVEAMADSATRQLTIVTQLTNGGVELTFTDTGKGIPDEVLQRLFQAPIPRPKGAKGLGAGLLMAHAIVETYGGDIRVGSTGSSGTTMIVWLPVEGYESSN